MDNHPARQRFKVTILRIDGTSWVVEHVKHVLYRDQVLELYLGEHGLNRVRRGVPWHLIDHFDIEEES